MKRISKVPHLTITKINHMKTISFISALFLILSFAFISSYAQEKETEAKSVFKTVEEMPEFPGGQEALRDFIMKNVRYPREAHEKGIQGRVYVQFNVDTDGSVTDASIIRSVDPLLDQEALHVVNAMPKWKPGKQKGQFVKVAYTIPVSFALEGEKPAEVRASLLVELVGNRLILSGQSGIIEKMLPYVMGAKPGLILEKENGRIIYTKPEGEIQDPVFFIVEEMPEFPGGESALRQYIANEIKYPVEAQKEKIQGKVYVTFIVNKEGMVQEPKVVRGVHASLDEEALRVVSSLPQWVPGRQKGQAVSVSYTVPISFVLQ